jgi:hypothetical protein
MMLKLSLIGVLITGGPVLGMEINFDIKTVPVSKYHTEIKFTIRINVLIFYKSLKIMLK